MPLPRDPVLTPLDDSEVFQVLYGHPAGQTPKELPAIKAMNKELLSQAYKLAPSFVRQVAIEGHRAGLDVKTIQYLFWVIFDSQKTWPVLPTMPGKALLMAKNLVENSGDPPGYHAGLTVPEMELEEVVNQCIEKIAAWCLSSMVPALRKEWARIVATQASKFDLPAMWLEKRFQEELIQRSHTFLESTLVFRIIRLTNP